MKLIPLAIILIILSGLILIASIDTFIRTVKRIFRNRKK